MKLPDPGRSLKRCGIGVGVGDVTAFAGQAAVVLHDASTDEQFHPGNSIFSNGNVGIYFGHLSVFANDGGNGDTGPNNLQKFPIITNAFGYAGSTIVQGKLNSSANRSCFVAAYRNLAEDFSRHGQGRFHLGTVSVNTDGSGNAVFALTNSVGNFAGQYISATAMAATGDPSEFSADVLASYAPAPFAHFAAPFAWRTNGFVFNLSFETNFSYHSEAIKKTGRRIWFRG